MKKRIENFVKTFFYFNSHERKGIYLLLGLIFMMLMAKWSLAFIFPSESIEISLQTLDELDSLSEISEYGNSYTKFKFDSTHNKNNYPHGYKNKAAFKFSGDSIFPVQKKKINQRLEINSADSISLVNLYRIGPVLASKIITYRNKLGGFKNLDQLGEIWGFDRDILYDLDGKIYVDPGKSVRYNLNTVSFEDLKQHPYFKYNLSQAIINYRKQHGNYQNLSDLKNIKFVTDSILKKIEPYVFVE